MTAGVVRFRTRSLLLPWIAALTVIVAPACARQASPAPLDPSHTQCGFCRMAVSDVRFAAQLAAPGVEPVFFDDLGCLRDHLSKNRQALPAGTVAFVADFRTRAWVRAADAVFTRPQGLATPMAGQIIAHESPGSRDDDPAAKGGTPVAPAAIFGGDGPPNGGRP